MKEQEKKYDVFVSQFNFLKHNYALINTSIDLLIDIKSKLYDIDKDIISKEVNESYKEYQKDANRLFTELSKSDSNK